MTKGSNNLPPRVVTTFAAVVVVCLLAYNIIADIQKPGYDGYGTTFILISFLGGILGIHRSFRGGGGEDK